MLHGGEPGHLRPNLTDDRQRCHFLDALDLGQVDADHVIQRRADVEARMIGFAATGPRPRSQGRQGPILLHPRQLLLNLRVHLVQLLWVELPRLVRLP